MKISKDTSAFSRYLRARSQPFTKPVVWGSLGGLLIAGVAIYQYWQHPEWIQTNSESINDSTPSGRAASAFADRENVADVSQDDLAAAANIDNLDLLIKEIEQNRTLSSIAAQNKTKQTQSSELKQEDSAFSRFQKEQQAKLNDPSKLSSATGLSSSGIGNGNQKIIELLQPPSFSSYQSSRNTPNSSFNPTSTSQTDIIPNPVGNIYLSNRNNKLPQPPAANPVATNSSEENSAAADNNLAAENTSVENVNPNGSGAATPNGASQPNEQPGTVNSNLPTRFVPPSSLTQTQSGYPTAGINPTSPYATGFNSLNPYAPSNPGGVPVNGTGIYNGYNSVGTGTYSGVNGVNGVNNSANVGAVSQPVPNEVPGSTTGFNSVNRDAATTEDGDSNSPSSLQNNYRSFRTISPSYNRSTPTGYQMQPQGYSTGGLGQSNGVYGADSVNGAGVGSNGSSYPPTANTPITNNVGTSSLQPSGVLRTSEIGQ